MKKILIPGLFFFISISSFSQKRFQIFHLAGNYNFMQTLPENDSKNFESSLMAQLCLPKVFKDSSAWYSQVDYHYFSVDNEFSLTSQIEQFNLHGFIFRTGYSHRFNSKQSLQILFSPRFMTDFNASFSNSIQLGGLLFYEKVKSEKLTWKIGVLYNQEFFGPYIVPVVNLNWKITQKIKLQGLIPVFGAIFLEPSKNLSAGLHFIGLTSSYRINEPNFENYYVDRRNIDVSLFSKIYMFHNFFLTARAGYSLSKDYGLFSADDKIDLGLPLVNIGDDRIRANNEFDGSPFVHLRVSYEVPVNRKVNKNVK